jgi:hypothetical protein
LEMIALDEKCKTFLTYIMMNACYYLFFVTG